LERHCKKQQWLPSLCCCVLLELHVIYILIYEWERERERVEWHVSAEVANK